MTTHRTAMGKTVDMAAILAKNEKTRAVGNMGVNARGDTIDAYGRIIKPVTAKVNEAYGKTVGNRSAHVNKNTPKPKAKISFSNNIGCTPLAVQITNSSEGSNSNYCDFGNGFTLNNSNQIECK